MSVEARAITKTAVRRAWRHMPVAGRADGVYIWDTDGKRYLDAAAGSSNLVTIGHGVKSVRDAMYAQMEMFSYAAPHAFASEPLLRLGDVVATKAHESLGGDWRSWFTCTGTDAVDSAVRLARQYHVARGDRSKTLVISRWQGFHGNNLAVAGIHGSTFRRRTFMGMNINSPHVPPAYCYRCPFEMRYPSCGLKCARALETEIRQQGEENVAAFIAEPIVGSALGGVPAPDGYFQTIREICDRYGVLMIVDEVMTAFGRLGRWFGIEHSGVTPDVIATAKGMTSGYATLAATIAREELWSTIEATGTPFLSGHTMDLNPVACAATLEVIRVLEDQDLLRKADETGAYLGSRLKELEDIDIVDDVRGMGMMWGFELVRDKETREPFDPGLHASYRVEAEAMRRGLILYSCTGSVDGVAGDMVMVTPPLVITRKQVDDVVALTRESLEAVRDELA